MMEPGNPFKQSRAAEYANFQNMQSLVHQQTLKQDTEPLFFVSEAYGEGHPDKLCDQVSDGILDACLKVDPKAKVTVETATKKDSIMLLGDVDIDRSRVDFEAIARKVCADVGFISQTSGLDSANCSVSVNVEG